jgi:hypothetical protein
MDLETVVPGDPPLFPHSQSNLEKDFTKSGVKIFAQLVN